MNRSINPRYKEKEYLSICYCGYCEYSFRKMFIVSFREDFDFSCKYLIIDVIYYRLISAYKHRTKKNEYELK